MVLRGMAGMQAKPDPLIASGPMIIAMMIVAGDIRDSSGDAQHDAGGGVERTPSVALAGIWTMLLFAVIIEQGQGSAFIYFAF